MVKSYGVQVPMVNTLNKNTLGKGSFAACTWNKGTEEPAHSGDRLKAFVARLNGSI